MPRGFARLSGYQFTSPPMGRIRNAPAPAIESVPARKLQLSALAQVSPGHSAGEDEAQRIGTAQGLCARGHSTPKAVIECFAVKLHAGDLGAKEHGERKGNGKRHASGGGQPQDRGEEQI